MGATRKWPRRKVTSLRRIIAKYRLGRRITIYEIENRPERVLDRLKNTAPIEYLPHIDSIVRDDRSVKWPS